MCVTPYRNQELEAVDDAKVHEQTSKDTIGGVAGTALDGRLMPWSLNV
jgi:hypothetical protein